MKKEYGLGPMDRLRPGKRSPRVLERLIKIIDNDKTYVHREHWHSKSIDIHEERYRGHRPHVTEIRVLATKPRLCGNIQTPRRRKFRLWTLAPQTQRQKTR